MGINPKIIIEFHSTYLEGAQVPDSAMELPIHRAIISKSPPEIILALHLAYVEGTEVFSFF